MLEDAYEKAKHDQQLCDQLQQKLMNEHMRCIRQNGAASTERPGSRTRQTNLHPDQFGPPLRGAQIDTRFEHGFSGLGVEVPVGPRKTEERLGWQRAEPRKWIIQDL